MFTLATIRCWLYKLSHYEYSYGSSIKYNKLTEPYQYSYGTSIKYNKLSHYVYNYDEVNNG